MDYIGKDDREITCRSTTVIESWSISSTEVGSKHDSNEMTSSQDSEYCKDYFMEDFELPFSPKLTGPSLQRLINGQR